MGNDTRCLPSQTIDALAARLAALPDLRLPSQLRQRAPSAAELKAHLSGLLARDPGIFLERHGGELTEGELAHFEGLRGDYEVDFYLKSLEAGRDERKRGAVARNRRLAAMHRLVEEGSFFSEKEMRERQPALHHHFIGQYREPEAAEAPGAGGCQAGGALTACLMRQQEEMDVRQRQQVEQQRWEQAESEQEESEEEESEEEDTGPAAATAAGDQQQHAAAGERASPAGAAAADAAAAEAGGVGASPAGPAWRAIPEAEAADNAAAFLDAMQQRFLGGQEPGVDYAAIDADAELDEDWAAQAGRDAEDAYFDD